MFARIQSFISRHRRKFFGVAVTGAVIWGGWSYMNWRMQRSEEEYVREVLKKAKRHMHHKSSAQAAERQVMALVPVAAKATNDALDATGIINQLKGSSKGSSKDISVQHSKGDKEMPLPLTPEERIAKWDELKRVSIARAVTYAYIPSILIVFIRLQLGLLGGYVFKSCGGDNIAAFLDGNDERQSKKENQENMPFEIQEAYLSLTQFFLEGQSNSLAQKQVDTFHKSQDEFLVFNEPYWSKNRCNSREGKSKLNLGQPMASGKARDTRDNSFGHTLQKCNGLVNPSKSQRETHHQILNDSDSVSGESMSDHVNLHSTEYSVSDKRRSTGDYETMQESTCSDKRFMVNTKTKVTVKYMGEGENNDCSSERMHKEIPSVCSKMKSMPLVNGISNSCDSIDGLKDTSSRETAEEDSGRCSGTDDISEDEVVDVKQIKSGIEVLCSLLEKKVGTVVDNISLKTPLSLAETETLFWGILTSIRANPAEDPAFNLPKYLLPSPEKIKETVQDIESHLSKKAATLFNEMVSETSDLLETKEVVELVQSCISAGLGHIMDRLAIHFPAENLYYDKTLSASTSLRREFQHKPTIPLAKLVPIINKVAFEEGSPWIKQLLEMGNLKDFGANVYEAFTH